MIHRIACKSTAFALAAILALTPALSADTAPVTGTKEERHARMVVLQEQIRSLRVQGGADADRQRESLQAELGQISMSLGGDLPCAVGPTKVGVTALAAAPTAPTNCTPTTTVFTNNTQVLIDAAGPNVVTSTIVVSGVGNYLWDVDVTTFLKHTFAADLDVTITSPAGTVVTLTSDNGAGNDDVFNGTVWDDSANPGGQVPYTNNNGLVTDHAYANGVLASPLVPEEALAAFIGENPNGTWTITISDDLAGDGGSLDQWSLNLTTFATAPTMSAVQSFTQSTPVAIPTGPAVVTSTVVVSGLTAPICKVEIRTTIPHTFAADIDMTVMSPNGTVVTLTTDNGAGNDNVFNGTTWSSTANPGGQVPYTTNNGLVTDHLYANLVTATPLVPEESLGAFNGENGNGTWTLTVSDDLAGDGGSIDSWSVDIITCSCPSADMGVTLTAAPAPVTAGTNLTYTATTINNGPSSATDVNVSLPLPAGTSLVSATADGGGTCTAANPVVCTWMGSTANGVTHTATVVVAVAASAVSGSTLSTTATVGPTAGDPVTSNNTSTANTLVATSANLSISLSANQSVLSPGTNLTYTAIVGNSGASDAQNMSMSLPLPAGTSLVSATATGGGTCVAANPVVCTWAGATPPGTSQTVTIVSAVSNSIVNVSVVNVTATATSATSDPVTSNNSSSVAFVLLATAVNVPGLGAFGLLLLIMTLALSGFAWTRRKQ